LAEYPVGRTENIINGGKYSVKKQSLYEQSFDQITKFILENNYAVGDALPTEGEFVSMLNVGRNTVREVLKTFQGMGIIETRKTGMVLRGLNLYRFGAFLPYAAMEANNSLKYMLGARSWYEDSVAPLIMQNATEDYIQGLRDNIEEYSSISLEDMEALIDCDRRFHIGLTECIPNPVIKEVGKSINEFFFLVPRSPERFVEKGKNRTKNEHLALVRCIEERDDQQFRTFQKESLTKWLNIEETTNSDRDGNRFSE